MKITSPRILIIDDEPLNSTLLQKILEAEGFDVVVAENGSRARELAAKNHPDLILLDIIMPKEDGYEVCRKFKENGLTAEIPIIFISAISRSEQKVKGFSLGAVDYITKPFDREEVLARVRLHLKLRLAMQNALNHQAARLRELKEAQLEILTDPDSMPEARFAIYYQTRFEAGGDFYEVIPFDKEIYGYFCADVSGHDLGSSLATSAFKALLPQNTGLLFTPEDSFKQINKVLTQTLPDSMYLTAVYAFVNRKQGIIKIASAGHPPAIYQPVLNKAEVINARGEMMGMFKTINLDSREIPVKKGDRLFLYSDGLIETDGTRPLSRADGIKRLIQAIEQSKTMELNQAVQSIIQNLFPPGTRCSDDIVLMGIRI